MTLADFPRAVRSVTSRGLTDLARERIEVISFFLLAFFVCAWIVQRIWNSLGKEFPRLPRLSYARALGFMSLWGLLFLLVLTMISGARELMTPGAWEKRGFTYRLVPTPPPPVEAEISARVEALETLSNQLFRYARSHGRVFPPPGQTGEIPEKYWHLPSSPSARYVYVGGQPPDEESYGGEKPLSKLAELI